MSHDSSYLDTLPCAATLSFPFPFISSNSEINSEFIHVPSLVHHGIKGKPLLLSVETHFSLDKADIQGTWSHTNPRGIRTTLVTFTKENAITEMSRRDSLHFREPDVSLRIKELAEDDEGDYHLSLNIEFHNKTGLVIKEERTVHVTVDGELSGLMFGHDQRHLLLKIEQCFVVWFSVPVSTPAIKKSPSYAVVEDKANVTWTCSVERGTRVVFQWLRDNVALAHSDRYHFSKDNSTLLISPVRKEDKGNYHCVASNPVSQGQHSRTVELTVYCK